jgi:hypothetical protein
MKCCPNKTLVRSVGLRYWRRRRGEAKKARIMRSEMESMFVQNLHKHPIDAAIIRVYYSGRRFKMYTSEK